MSGIRVELGARSYTVTVGAGVLGHLGPWVAENLTPSRIAIVSHPRLLKLHGPALMAGLDHVGVPLAVITTPPGERHKTIRTVTRLWSRMVRAGIDRRGVVVVLGGGMLGDTGGFAAATYMRGIPVVQAPTTLLAQVDAAVGGKVGVDLPDGKNLVGAFHQPRAVFADVLTLATLPRRDLRAGLAEVIKYGIICNEPLFRLVRSQYTSLLAGDPATLEPIISGCCAIKAAIVSEDETESGRRAILNFGHTVGHAVESLTGYCRYLHGEAVAIGMVAACLIGEEAGITPPDLTAEVRGAVLDLGLPAALPDDVSPQEILAALLRDKKAVGGRPRFVLARRLAEVVVEEVPEQAVLAGLRRHVSVR
ncbi:MAG TPA: 3-dehydroquinate synthase [Chthonomonadales bacterium]|nr:3-dehydroquinate synthase [Chthonomonadales bacterium]